MKLLFVCENYIPHYGGVEVVFKNLAEGLVKSGHQVDLVTRRLKGTKKYELLNGVTIHRIPSLNTRYFFTFTALPKLLKLAQKADLIQTTTFNGAPPSWLAGQIRKKPVVLTVHEVWINRWKEVTELNRLSCLLHNLLEKAIYSLKFNRYVCVSEATQKDLLKLKIPQEKTRVIYNGIDYGLWNPNKEKGENIKKKLALEKNFVYLFSGRPGTSKGLSYLIQAVPLISKKIPEAKLLALVSQDSAYKNQYRAIIELIKKLNILNKVIIRPPPPHHELPAYFSSADCVIIPSLSEGFCFAAADACALDVPVIASDTASLPEVVSGKYLLVEPKDPRAIAEAVFSAYHKKYKESKKKYFYKQENINNYLKLYQNLLKKND